MPDKDALPVPSDDYFEIECAKLHGGWPAWLALSQQLRGWLMAHEMEKNMRDHYYFEVREKSGGKGSEPAPGKDISALIRDRWQGRGTNIADKI